MPDRRLDNDQTSFNEKYRNHTGQSRSGCRSIGFTGPGSDWYQRPFPCIGPGSMMLRAEALVRVVREAARNACELGRREEGCPVHPSAHTALEREDAFAVLLLLERRCRQIGSVAETVCVWPDQPDRSGDGRRSPETRLSARLVAGDPTTEYRRHPEFRAAKIFAMSLLNWIFSNHSNM